MFSHRYPSGRLVVASWLFVAAFLMLGCSGESNSDSGVADRVHASQPVKGTVRGNDVQMAHADFDNQLAIYEGDGWGFNPSLLIFLFLDGDEVPEGRTFEVRSDGSAPGFTPHVHYRWRDRDSGDIETEVAVDDYEMKLTFGNVDGGTLPGTIRFAVPGENTRVEGKFVARIKR